MRSYIKIYGPPVMKAIKELQKIAIDMPEVSIMDRILVAPSFDPSNPDAPSMTQAYFGSMGGTLTRERSEKIVSKYGEMLGEHDFFFEWARDPSCEDVNKLIERIDGALAPLGCRYTITTR